MTSSLNAPRRHLGLSGAVNLRDIGGYSKVGGGRTRFGRVYRSDSLAELTDDDVQRVAELGLSAICDLRHSSERATKPNRSLPGLLPTLHEIGFLPHRAHEMVSAAREPGASAEAMRDDIRETYRRFVNQDYGVFREFLEIILQPRSLPLLVHCTSGKDRTGMAIAILLMAIGIPDSIIMEDYLLSNQYRRDLAYLAGSEVPSELLDVMMEVHPSYIAASLEEMDRHWGSREEFLTVGLGLCGTKRAQLMQLLVDPDA